MRNSNPLEMSDDDFLNSSLANMDSFDEPQEEAQEEPPEGEESVEEEDTNEEEITDTSDEDEESGESDDEPQGEEEEIHKDSESEEEDDSNEEEPPKDEEEGEDKKDDPEKEESDESIPDAEEQLKKLFSPFKANGKEIRVDSVDDAIRLMQMGANYSKKMAALKPGLRVLKMLEQNELLDERKISFLIDIDKKNPEAITRLLKESGVDPLEIDLDKSEEYKPGTYNVSDNEVAIDSILEDIRDTPSYKRTIDVVSNKWDDSSRKTFYEQPELIRVINEHMESGVYDQITEVMERERLLGRLNGLSDLQAYKAIGDQLFGQQGQQGNQPANAPKVVKGKQSANAAADDSKLKSRKKAAGETRATMSSKKKDDDFNPLALSDEEFEKHMAAKQL